MKLGRVRSGIRGRAARDRTQPERISTPFRAFVRETYPMLQEENPHLDYYDLRTMMQDIWDVLDEEQQKYYEDLVKRD